MAARHAGSAGRIDRPSPPLPARLSGSTAPFAAADIPCMLPAHARFRAELGRNGKPCFQTQYSSLRPLESIYLALWWGD
jgi:hypothetical protein